MKFKVLFFPIVTTLALSSAVFAENDPVCPTVESIQQVGLNHIYKDKSQWVATYLPSQKYGTDNEWSIIIGPSDPEVPNADDATLLARATEAAQTLTYAGKVKQYEHTICGYIVGKEGMTAAAFTPPVGPLMFSRLIK